MMFSHARFAVAIFSLLAGLYGFGADAAHAGDSPRSPFGVIEVGGSGIKASVYDISPKQALALLSDEAATQGFRYTAFKKALVQDYQPVDTKLSTIMNWQVATDAINTFKARMQKEYNVPADKIYIVASSSVREIPQFKQFQDKVRREVGTPLEAVSVEQECSLTFRWLVPGTRTYQALVIDVGSGNTKACYAEPTEDKDRRRAFELLPYGTKTFETEIKKLKRPNESFAEASARARTLLIDPKIDTQSSGNSGLRARRRLYLVGGAPWVATTYTHLSEINTDWVRLSAPRDFEAVREASAEGKVLDPDLDGIRDPAARAKASRDLAKVGTVFTPDQLLDGMDILIAISEDLHVSTEKDVVFFARPGVDAWRSRFLIEKIAHVANNDLFTP
jgi:Ppx/GppA phosphatase family protein